MPSSQLKRVEKSIEAMRSDPHTPKTAETTEALEDLVDAVRAVESRRIATWIFNHYLAIAPPSFVDSGRHRSATPVRRLDAAAAA